MLFSYKGSANREEYKEKPRFSFIPEVPPTFEMAIFRSLNRTCEALPVKYSRSEMKIKARFYFAFLSLNRTFEALHLKYSRSGMQKKNEFSFCIPLT